MNRNIVILDMDKTVFPTWEFLSDVAQVLHEEFHIDKEQFYDSIDGRHVMGADNLRHYDFFAHIYNLGLDGDEVEKCILHAFRERDYVYDDVPQFINFLLSKVTPTAVMLLTYGEQRFQQLKYKCAPTLSNLACVDTLEPKNQYIKKHFAHHHGIIIDDKLINDLPVSFKGVLLKRDANNASDGYSSLSQIQQQWSELYHTPKGEIPK